MSITSRSIQAYKYSLKISAIISLHYPELRDAPLSEIIARLNPARHSPDFRSVRWFGKDYTFTPAQAVIVRELWKAWRHGTPRVGAAALLESADMVSDNIYELFKRCPAWGTMIQSDRGVYWLVEE